MTGWPDPELVVAQLLGTLGTVVTRTTPDITSLTIKVNRVGGGDDRITDQARIGVIVYAPTVSEAKLVAEAARQLIIGAPEATDAGVIDRGRTETGPAELGTSDPATIRAVSAVYRVSLRRPA